ncbi:MAG: hypothetical protein VX498_02795 [Myxococcota bacterium]|nr:hypothetical protein [Myxococcota bacterium]
MVSRLAFMACLVLLLSSLLVGCGNVCDQMCDAQADMIDRCLDSWETSWEELSYSDRQDFLARCDVVWGDTLDDLDEDDPVRVDVETRCSRDLQTAQSDIDCQSLVSIDP